MNKNDILTTEELFDEFNKLGAEAKTALSININVYNAIQLMNVPSDYDKVLDSIDYHINSWKDTKNALKELNRNVVVKRCQKLEERAKAFVTPEKVFVMTDVKANDFARMVSVLTEVSRHSVADCSRIIYDVLERLNHLRNYQNKQGATEENIINSANLLEEFCVDISKDSVQTFTDLHSRWESSDSAKHISIAEAIGGTNKYYVLTLIGNWEKFSNPISLGKVVESVYSLKETTEAMDRYFAGLKESL